MKIKNVICLSSVFAILLTGCTSELDENSASQRQEIKLSSSIWGGTRVAVTASISINVEYNGATGGRM